MNKERVHIVPVRYERDRVVEPLVANNADRAYLLSHEGDQRPEYYDDIDAALTEAGVEVTWLSVDQYDMYAVLGLVTTLAEEHAGDSVWVNVSSGSHLAAIGAALGCMDLDTDASHYHVEPERHTHQGQERPLTEGYAAHTELQTYPIDSPTRSQVAVLAIIAAEDDDLSVPKKRTIIGGLMKLELTLERPLSVGQKLIESAEEIDHDTEEAGFDDLDSDEQRGSYAILDANAFDELEQRGYVDVDTGSRRNPVELTPRGVKALRAFRHKIPDVIAALESSELPDWLRDDIGDEVTSQSS